MAHVQAWRFPFKTPAFQLDLCATGDWQLGSSSCCEWKIDQAIDDMLERQAFYRAHVPIAKMAAISVGDLEDEDRPTTREYRARLAAERAEVVERDAAKHVAWLEGDLLPRLKRLHEGLDYGLIGGVAGHHWTFLAGGAKVGEKTVYSSVEYIFARLEQMTGKPCVYMGPMVSFLDFTFERDRGREDGRTQAVRVMGLLQHGEGGGQTKGATLGRLERTAQGFDADFYIRGHDCQLVATKTDILYAAEGRSGGGQIRSRTRTMLNLGSATMGYELSKGRSSYIESGMMRPTTMGWGSISFKISKASRYEDANGNYTCRTAVEI